MAVCIALTTSTGESLGSPASLDSIAANFLDWYADDPADIGVQTAQVLGAVDGEESHPAAAMREIAARLHERTGRTAGNGGVMRNAVVGISHLDDRDATARAAGEVARLTHHDPLASDSCILWSEAVRRAVLDGVLDLRGGLDLIDDERRAHWELWIDEAETEDPDTFSPNGFTVTALQAAWSSIVSTSIHHEGPAHVRAALVRAIMIGHDTDTVAAIAGGLLGARYGAYALPREWIGHVHGWPGMWAGDLIRLAERTAGCNDIPTDGRQWDWDLLERAAALAMREHRGDLRKGSAIPSISHVWSVAALVMEHGGDSQQAAAALLHDVAEDHGGETALATIAAECGQEVADMVRDLSDSLAEDPTNKAP